MSRAYILWCVPSWDLRRFFSSSHRRIWSCTVTGIIGVYDRCLALRCHKATALLPTFLRICGCACAVRYLIIYNRSEKKPPPSQMLRRTNLLSSDTVWKSFFDAVTRQCSYYEVRKAGFQGNEKVQNCCLQWIVCSTEEAPVNEMYLEKSK